MQNLISSLQHPLVKHLVKLRQSRSYRRQEQSVVIEGLKPVVEACQKITAKVVITSDIHKLPPGLRYEKMYVVTEAVMAKVSGMVNSEGLLAEMPMPAHGNLNGKRSILVLDSINEPGNMGTLLRTAVALGWEGAFLVGDCCDPFNEKALRAARGACFELPLRYGSWEELKALAERQELLPLLADLDGQPPSTFSGCGKVLLVLSNEARGPSAEALSWCKKVSIPLSGKMESLNVAIAGAILMYVIHPLTPNS